ncbi:acylpyruvase FAHD1, mitochondrial-like [Ursus maritimus]|uniref:Acylpyruvase FAHD1, mitochondrial-like n=1 Tax=Ursus maritimus TaxID=29073 RepID=A0A384CZC7_URSMA|nr:acylpyruvase FAHD1, mitochondrial-like [Ursus maritimus]
MPRHDRCKKGALQKTPGILPRATAPLEAAVRKEISREHTSKPQWVNSHVNGDQLRTADTPEQTEILHNPSLSENQARVPGPLESGSQKAERHDDNPPRNATREVPRLQGQPARDLVVYGQLSGFQELGKSTTSVGRNYVNHILELRRAAQSRAGALPEAVHHRHQLRAWPSSSPPTAPACTDAVWLCLPRGHSHRLCGQLCRGYDHQRCAGPVQEGTVLALAMSFTVFSPISTFVPEEKIPDPHNLKLWPKVNGKLRRKL